MKFFCLVDNSMDRKSPEETKPISDMKHEISSNMNRIRMAHENFDIYPSLKLATSSRNEQVIFVESSFFQSWPELITQI